MAQAESVSCGKTTASAKPTAGGFCSRCFVGVFLVLGFVWLVCCCFFEVLFLKEKFNVNHIT